MNLVTEPWVPVVTLNGKPDYASLMDIFTAGKLYSDISVRPHERVALMRLFICIAQAALGGPNDADDWNDAPAKLPDAAYRYLEMWNKEEVFDLFHPIKPFLQVSDLKPLENDKSKKTKSKGKEENIESETFTSLSKLDISLATGANTTLFDQRASASDQRVFEDRRVALNLLTYLNFSASGRIGVSLWNSIPSPGKGASFPAICIDKLMIHSFLRNENLLGTICLNILTKPAIKRHFGNDDAWGRPIWEHFPNGFDDEKAIQNATATYLGRLVPLSRAIRIRQAENDLILANGLKYPLADDGRFETDATIKIIGNKRVVLRVNSNAIWRELHAITVVNTTNRTNASGPKTLENINESDFDIWCGGVEWTTKGGYVNSVESIYNVSNRMLQDECRAIYQNEVAFAEYTSKKLCKAIEHYRSNIDGYWLTRSDPKKNKKAFQEKELLHAKATHFFWTNIEKKRHNLMALVDAWGDSQRFEDLQKNWQDIVNTAAQEAYTTACAQETPRQIRAFALGWKKLFMEKNMEAEIEEQNDDGGEEL